MSQGAELQGVSGENDTWRKTFPYLVAEVTLADARQNVVAEVNHYIDNFYNSFNDKIFEFRDLLSSSLDMSK